MTKKEQLVVDQYYKDYNIDLRTMGMIVHHYIDIGERAAANITQEQIDKIYQQELVKQKQAESEGKIYMITPEFTAYLLTACMGLANLAPTIRYKIIKEWVA